MCALLISTALRPRGSNWSRPSKTPIAAGSTAATPRPSSRFPGTPIAYWASDALLDAFANAKQLNEFGKPRQGLATGDNERFTRLWWEPEVDKARFGVESEEEAFEGGGKWFPYNKGGNYRKWYGNNDWVVTFNRANSEILATLGNHLPSRHLYFKPMLTWSKVSMLGYCV